MDLKDIRENARKQGAKTGKMKKDESILLLIRLKESLNALERMIPVTVHSLIVHGEKTV